MINEEVVHNFRIDKIPVLLATQDAVPCCNFLFCLGLWFLFCFLQLKGTRLEYHAKAFSACGLGTFVSQCLHSALFL